MSRRDGEPKENLESALKSEVGQKNRLSEELNSMHPREQRERGQQMEARSEELGAAKLKLPDFELVAKAPFGLEQFEYVLASLQPDNSQWCKPTDWLKTSVQHPDDSSTDDYDKSILQKSGVALLARRV